MKQAQNSTVSTKEIWQLLEMEAAESQDSRQEQLSAKTETTLNPFRSVPCIGMHGKVSRSFCLFPIDHIVATICQFVEIHLHRGMRDSAGQAQVARWNIQGLGTSDCKTELCTRHILPNSSIDRGAHHRSPLRDSLS
jgi:hypothetical protein